MKTPLAIYGGAILIAVVLIYRLAFGDRKADHDSTTDLLGAQTTSNRSFRVSIDDSRNEGIAVPTTNMTQLGREAGILRKKAFKGPRLSDAEKTSLYQFTVALRNRRLSDLEFVEFQSAFVDAALSLADAEKSKRIRELISQGRQEATTRRLEPPPRIRLEMSGGSSEWELLDRRVTRQIEEVLSVSEQQEFVALFKGVLDIDLGVFFGEPGP